MTLWVVKIGTSLLRGDENKSTLDVINSICSSISQCKLTGDHVVLVTSGAVGLGCKQMGFKERPRDLSSLQAVASIGQGHLMSLYKKSMNRHGFNVGQVLLTRSDFNSRSRYKNASLTIKKLLDLEVLPIVNENDTISSEELVYGDNDTLSALVATSIQADQLIILTDVDKLYSSDPRTNIHAKPITDVHNQKEIENLENDISKKGEWGTGGITTKLSAARIATESGITVQLADGRDPNILNSLFKGSRGGTIFHPHPKPLGNKKSWLAHAIDPIGNVLIDEGAREALINHGASLLLVGIQSIEGIFKKNQPVRVLDMSRNELGRGLISISSDEIQCSLENQKKSNNSPIAIHRDVFVLTCQKNI